MKIIIRYIWVIPLLILSLTACGSSGDTTTTTPTPIEWGEITSFSSGWGDFHGGHQFFRIQKIDSQYMFNAQGEMGVQLFVPENHPIPAYEVENLRNILEDINAGRWDGFSSPICDDCTSDWSFSLRVEMETGASIEVFVGCCVRPSGFWADFSVLSTFLHDMAVQHQAEPAWGGLSFVSFTISGINIGGTGRHHRISSRHDGRVYFGHVPNQVEREPHLMQELHQLLIDYDVISWWDGHRRDIQIPEGTDAYRIQIDVYFDNDTGFSAWGRVPLCPDDTRRDSPSPRNIFRPQCDAVNALLDFFEEIERQIAEEYLAHP